MKTSVITFTNLENNTFFFSTNHCQNHDLGNNYVPCTHTIPSSVVPRESVPSGIVKNIEDLKAVFYDDLKEIPNPDENYQPNF